MHTADAEFSPAPLAPLPLNASCLLLPGVAVLVRAAVNDLRSVSPVVKLTSVRLGGSVQPPSTLPTVFTGSWLRSAGLSPDLQSVIRASTVTVCFLQTIKRRVSEESSLSNSAKK